jgi:hypothetical protein
MVETDDGLHHDRTALILYGSETGNSQDVAEELGRVAQRLHFQARVCEMDQVDLVRPPLPPELQMLMTYGIEITLEIHHSSVCSRDHRTRRVPEEFQALLEKSLEKAFAP